MQGLIMYEVRDAILEEASERTYSVVASSVRPDAVDMLEQERFEQLVEDELNRRGTTVVDDSADSAPDTWDDL